MRLQNYNFFDYNDLKKTKKIKRQPSNYRLTVFETNVYVQIIRSYWLLFRNMLLDDHNKDTSLVPAFL